MLRYHIVWCVKYRRSVLTTGIGDRLKEILTILINNSGCQSSRNASRSRSYSFKAHASTF
ncbi:MAG: transposase [Blastocatellia bacterium]|nr:transposase [Blastocatellia bacterium]